MRHVVCGVVAMALVLDAGLSSRDAAAQAMDAKAMAEQLFNQARELAKAEKWEEACPKFEASFKYDPVLGTKLNLATCFERTGKLASAWGLYRDSIELAKKANDPKRADYATKQAAALEPRLPTLRITLPEKPPAGLVVARDGTALDAGAFGVALYIDPGTHEVTASAPGFVPFKQSVTLAEGKAETLAIPTLATEPRTPVKSEPPVPGTPGTSEEPKLDVTKEPPRAPSRTRFHLGLGAGGAGVVALGAGMVFGLKAMSTQDELERICGGSRLECPANQAGRGQDLYDTSKSQAMASTILVIGGGVAVAAGAVLILTAPRAKERAASARLLPTMSDGGAGIAAVGRF
jgi:hypothetical protein